MGCSCIVAAKEMARCFRAELDSLFSIPGHENLADHWHIEGVNYFEKSFSELLTVPTSAAYKWKVTFVYMWPACRETLAPVLSPRREEAESGTSPKRQGRNWEA